MKKDDITTVVKKEFIYEVYDRIVDNPKDYEKITRKKMIQEIFDYYKEDNHLEMCLTYQDILDLKEILKNKTIPFGKGEHLFKLLLLDYVDYNMHCLNKEILSFIEEKINSYDLEEAKQRDEKNNLLIGMIKAYGIVKEMNFVQLIGIFNQLNGTDLDFERDILCNRIIREYYVVYDYKYTKNIVYKIFEYYIDDCMKMQDEGDFHVKLFEYDTLMNIAKYDFDISVSKLKKLYNEINKIECSYVRRVITEYIIVMVNLGNEYEDIEEIFLDSPFISSSINSKLLKCIENAIDDIPLAIFYGMTTNEIMKKEEIEDKNFEYLQSVNQSRACLGSKEARNFYKMYMNILDYVNKNYDVVKERGLAIAKHVDPQNQAKIRNKLFEDLSIIDEYITLNPNRLNNTVLKQVEEVKNAILIECMIIKYEGNYTLVMDNEDIIYAIIGGVCNIDEIIPAYDLPYMCKLALIPYKGKIIYDGVIEGSNVRMGPGIQSRIVESIKNAEIHKTLPIITN